MFLSFSFPGACTFSIELPETQSIKKHAQALLEARVTFTDPTFHLILSLMIIRCVSKK